ncbi:MAG: AMP-binding protein [Actinobacteria bacterium]|nr:AMP-binding protein [Actinomycetota bacterium]
MGEVHEMARRVAGALHRQGVGPGDTVAFQMPNCVEAAAVFWAAALLGAAVVPIVHFYGAKEVGFIEGDAAPAVFLSQEGAAELIAGPDVLEGPLPVDAGERALIAYTSGTTADPKGVIHTHRSIVAESQQLAANQPPDSRPLLVGAPVGHAIGMLSGLLIPLVKGRSVHLIDKWDPADVLAAVVEGDLTAGSGSTYFLTSLLDAPEFGPQHLERMRYIGLGGSPVPAAVAERATDLGISIVRSYGSTEHPSTTGSLHEFPREKRLYTDGRPLPGVELRLAADGEILSRGPDLFAGYTDAALTAEALDGDGWYHTGDIGALDDDGFLTITDRKKDVIDRGGEKVSAVEVEEALAHVAGVAEVAVVAAPDARLGEHGAAFFRMQPGVVAPSLDELRATLAAAGLARQKWPEEVHTVSEFPRTPSGKVRKVELRARLRGA